MSAARSAAGNIATSWASDWLASYAPAVTKAVPAGGRERGERRAPVEGIAVPLDVSGPLKNGDHLGN